LRIAFIFESATPAGMHVPMHAHEVLEFVYYTHGRGTSEINGIVHNVQAGVFTITPSGLSHNQRNETEVVSICLGLNKTPLEAYTGAWPDVSGDMGPACRKLMWETNRYGVGHNRVFAGLLLQVTALAEREAKQARPLSRQDTLLAQAEAVVRQRAGRLTVAELSSELCVSPSHLRHIFSQYSDHAPKDLISRVRLEHAMNLLANPSLNIQEIAYACGFSSPYYFSRFFKKEMGAPPSQIRDHIADSDKD
jgi:AraC-like DNA-binding protein